MVFIDSFWLAVLITQIYTCDRRDYYAHVVPMSAAWF